MEVIRLLAKALDENCYVVREDERITIIDPGYGVSTELAAFEDKKHLRALLTHGHADHIFDLDQIETDEIIIHPMDKPMLLDAEKSFLNLFGKNALLLGGKKVLSTEVLRDRWKCLHTPGHTEGSCCFLFDERFLFSGDTVFSASVGRTDLPGGDHDQMTSSINRLKELFTKMPDLIVFPGHGRQTTARIILRENPFFM
ncbi:Zn-dependent hydrolase [Mesotoga sp. HF07.pep.5.2.highcov]|uniref:Zn-dependent hydrolase, glyoxylase n=1 Tax=Mesotoga prima MesG1.Ag.4.2 TaxID=660470 RepID=I2F796_9BACT|nr:Zn-dependent hydrolase, glyoxylase [Mesotoga prima MesG1.Ag.4.2]PIJ60573.1 Zn-dependent hydrolase [Mesotoga sp. H07.pep.5.3]RLL84191.1 Zn-dependent hydrolase [Mesotoga sp. H07pep.5.4]RLL92527.1 Zn-dependent hydrolase [Mesotoga sp. HF07.pep.5.2.highcov]